MAQPAPKAKKYSLKKPLATAIPGYKPKPLTGGGSAPKKKKGVLKRKRGAQSKKDKARYKSANFAQNAR